MPLIVHITREDAALWTPLPRRGERYYYAVQPPIMGLVLSSPAPLSSYYGEDVLLRINSERMDAERRTHLYIEQLARKLEGSPRRLRLRIASIDARLAPPRVYLEEMPT